MDQVHSIDQWKWFHGKFPRRCLTLALVCRSKRQPREPREVYRSSLPRNLSLIIVHLFLRVLCGALTLFNAMLNQITASSQRGERKAKLRSLRSTDGETHTDAICIWTNICGTGWLWPQELSEPPPLPPRAVIIFNQTIPFQTFNQLFHDLGFMRATVWLFTTHQFTYSCVNICDEVADRVFHAVIVKCVPKFHHKIQDVLLKFVRTITPLWVLVQLFLFIGSESDNIITWQQLLRFLVKRFARVTTQNSRPSSSGQYSGSS